MNNYDNYAKFLYNRALTERPKWRSLFLYLYSQNEYLDIINLYKSLLYEGVITHSIEEYCDDPGVVDSTEMWILHYTILAYDHIIDDNGKEIFIPKSE